MVKKWQLKTLDGLNQSLTKWASFFIKRCLKLISGFQSLLPQKKGPKTLFLVLLLVCPHFSYAKPITESKEAVILVHGLMRTYLSMRPLKFYLEKQGYEVFYYSYPSKKYSIHQHALEFQQYLNTFFTNNPKQKVHLVTHSLGGIISREALSHLSKKQLRKIGYLVMLAPPNQGSKLAKLSQVVPLLSSVKPLAELSSDTKSYVHQVPIPKVKMGIIAGRFDAKVPPYATHLPGQPAPEIVNATHTFIMNNNQAKYLVNQFLKQGTFKPS